MVVATRRSRGNTLSVSQNDESKKIMPVKKKVKKSTKRVEKSMEEIFQEQIQRRSVMYEEHLLQRKKQMEYLLKAGMKDIRNMFLNGLTFNPTEGQLVNFYLRRKNSYEPLSLCPIQEVEDLYANHPKTLIEEISGHNSCYFFTHRRPNESGADVQGEWKFAEKEDIIHEDKKIGLRQVFEFYEEGEKKEYRVKEYELYPAPNWPKDYIWFLCKFYIDSSYVAVQT